MTTFLGVPLIDQSDLGPNTHFTCRRTRKLPRHATYSVITSPGGAVAIAHNARRCRLLGRIEGRWHVLIDVRGPGWVTVAAIDWSDMLRLAEVSKQDRQLSLFQLSRIFYSNPVLKIPPQLARRLWYWNVALHESGHAVVAHSLGYAIHSITIKPTAEYSGQYVHDGLTLAGEISQLSTRKHKQAAIRGSIDQILIALAGPIAETHGRDLLAVEIHSESFDPTIRLVAEAAQSDLETVWDELGDLSEFGKAKGVINDRDLWTLTFLEDTVTRRLWSHICRLAVRLLQKRTLKAPELKVLLRGVPNLNHVRQRVRRRISEPASSVR